ncbi:MAG: lactonase family protein [Amnibacterium sp.]
MSSDVTGHTSALLEAVLVACLGDEDAPGGLYSTAAGDGGPAVPVGGLACVVRHPVLPVAYGVSGPGDGVLHTWSTDGAFRTSAPWPTGGTEPCHIAVHPGGLALIVTNYESGSLAVFRLDPAGLPVGPGRLVPLQGSGPVAGRQDSAHPHQAVVLGDDLVLVPDLGADLVRAFRIDPGHGSLTAVAESRLPAGTGPRHLVHLPDGTIAVTGELAQTVAVGRLDPGTGRVLEWRTAPSTRGRGFGPNYPSDLIAVPGTSVVITANRGADTLARIDVGRPALLDEADAGVRWPQHLALVEDHLLVAGRDSSLVVALPLATDGRMGAPQPVTTLPRPVWLTPGVQG